MNSIHLKDHTSPWRELMQRYPKLLRSPIGPRPEGFYWREEQGYGYLMLLSSARKVILLTSVCTLNPTVDMSEDAARKVLRPLIPRPPALPSISESSGRPLQIPRRAVSKAACELCRRRKIKVTMHPVKGGRRFINTELASPVQCSPARVLGLRQVGQDLRVYHRSIRNEG